MLLIPHLRERILITLRAWKNIRLKYVLRSRRRYIPFKFIEGKEFKVRLLIVDSPETAKEGKEAQPFADEAKKRTEELLTNAKKIEGSFDVGDHSDKYDRALMYVYVDGKLLQDILIEEGLARVGYAYEPNTSLLKQFQEIEKKAKKTQEKYLGKRWICD